MAISALLIAYPQYRTVFPSLPVEIAPGVGQLQTWMDGGWREGYDEIGNRQMKGKIVGTRKWIGTSGARGRGIFCEIPLTRIGQISMRCFHAWEYRAYRYVTAARLLYAHRCPVLQVQTL